jgi:hypothetical protein
MRDKESGAVRLVGYVLKEFHQKTKKFITIHKDKINPRED